MGRRQSFSQCTKVNPLQHLGVQQIHLSQPRQSLDPGELSRPWCALACYFLLGPWVLTFAVRRWMQWLKWHYKVQGLLWHAGNLWKFDIFDCRHLEYRHTVLLDPEVLGPAIVTSAKALRAFPSQLANSRFALYIQIVHHIKFISNDESVLYLSLYYTYIYCLKLNDEWSS